jgi:serine phosphatase RsbU (regulator of sigma subunit)
VAVGGRYRVGSSVDGGQSSVSCAEDRWSAAPDDDFTSILAELAEAVATDQTLVGILERVADIGCTALTNCAGASITLMDGGRPITAVFTADFALELDLAQYEADLGPCLLALRRGKVVHFSDTDDRWPTFSEAARQHGIYNTLSVPLAVGDVALGALNLYSNVAEGLTSDTDEATASLLAEHAVAAVATAQAYEAERTMALTLQRSLLPDRLPEIAGYQLAGRYLPGSSRAEVGGDWYDGFARDDGAVAVVIGDVAGHGLKAATVMGQLRTGVRAYALAGSDPATCLTLLSKLLDANGNDQEPHFATACVALVDPVTGMCRVASAGHLPPAIRDPDGTVRFIHGYGGTPLGVDRMEEVPEDFSQLEPGAALVLFTDGLIEDRRRSLDEGLTQLAAALAEGSGSADDLCDRLVNEMLVGRRQEDDIAVLVLLRLPSS